jgi:signal transduction histidine kinase
MDDKSTVKLSQLSIYETALQHSANAIALCETVRNREQAIVDFRYLFINRRYEELAKQSTQAVSGQLASVLFPNARTTDVWKWAAQVVETGQEHRQELLYTTNSGYTGWFDVTITRWEEFGIIISLMDITGQKARLLAERKQAELLRQVVSSSFNGILVAESVRNAQHEIVDFKFVLANEAAKEVNGYTVEQLTNSTLLTLFPALRQVPYPGSDGREKQTIFERYIDVAETGEAVLYDINYQHDGLAGWYWVAVSRLNDGLIMTFLDISDLKYTQQQLERTIRELKRTNQSLEQFAYVASHDLQEPLRKIQSFGDLLIDRLAEDPNDVVRDLIQRMQSSAQRMQGLVKDLLAYSRLTNRQEGVAPVRLERVVKQALDDLQPMIDETSAVVDISSLPVINGDAAQLQQMFFCLLNNSLKFHKPGTPPHLLVSADFASADQLPGPLVGTDRPYVAISIQDHGIGFDKKYLDRIFTIFQRLHGRGHYKGNGIGLSLARKVVENHGGTLTAHSEPGKGATFTAWLPIG